MSDPDKIDTLLIKDFLMSVKDLQSEVVALKNRITSSNNLPTGTTQNGIESSQDTPLQYTRNMSDNNPPPEESNHEAVDSSNEEDSTFTLSEVGKAFMEAATKIKLSIAVRKKKIMKLDWTF